MKGSVCSAVQQLSSLILLKLNSPIGPQTSDEVGPLSFSPSDSVVVCSLPKLFLFPLPGGFVDAAGPLAQELEGFAGDGWSAIAQVQRVVAGIALESCEEKERSPGDSFFVGCFRLSGLGRRRKSKKVVRTLQARLGRADVVCPKPSPGVPCSCSCCRWVFLNGWGAVRIHDKQTSRRQGHWLQKRDFFLFGDVFFCRPFWT